MPPSTDQPNQATAPAAGPPQATELKTRDSGGSPRHQSWQRVTGRAQAQARVAALLVAILVLGAAGGWFVSQGLKTPTATKTTPTKVETLSPADIDKLSQVGTSLGNSNQVLTVGANSVFQGKVDVGSDLTLNGKLNGNGAASLSSLQIAGATSLSDLAVQKNLQVSGLTALQNGLTVNSLLAVTGNLTVSGSTSVSNLTAGVISANQLQLNGPLSLGHTISSGPPATATSGSSLVGAGTISISGNDTAGTIVINTGTAPVAGSLINVTFHTAYGAPVHVLLTPRSGAAAGAPVYTSTSATGFSVRIDSPPPSSSTLSFDYFVTQ